MDKAVLLLARYDDSMSAVRGARPNSSSRPNSMVAMTIKIRPALPKIIPQLCHWKTVKRSMRRGVLINTAWKIVFSRMLQQSSASTDISLQQERQPVITPTKLTGRDTGVLGAPIQNAEDSNLMNTPGNFGTVNDDDVISDAPRWSDIFADYHPPQRGFDFPFVIEELLPHAP